MKNKNKSNKIERQKKRGGAGLVFVFAAIQHSYNLIILTDAAGQDGASRQTRISSSFRPSSLSSRVFIPGSNPRGETSTFQEEKKNLFFLLFFFLLPSISLLLFIFLIEETRVIHIYLLTCLFCFHECRRTGSSGRHWTRRPAASWPSRKYLVIPLRLRNRDMKKK